MQWVVGTHSTVIADLIRNPEVRCWVAIRHCGVLNRHSRVGGKLQGGERGGMALSESGFAGLCGICGIGRVLGHCFHPLIPVSGTGTGSLIPLP